MHFPNYTDIIETTSFRCSLGMITIAFQWSQVQPTFCSIVVVVPIVSSRHACCGEDHAGRLANRRGESNLSFRLAGDEDENNLDGSDFTRDGLQMLYTIIHDDFARGSSSSNLYISHARKTPPESATLVGESPVNADHVNI